MTAQTLFFMNSSARTLIFCEQPCDSISEHGEQDHNADIIQQEEHKRLTVINVPASS